MSIFPGATINGEHTLRDWGAAIINSDIVSVPEPNLTILEIPGRNGRLDLSEALTGDVTYANRTIKLQLAGSVSPESWYQKCLHIFNAFHGRTVDVIFDDDSTHYYHGRASVSDPQRVRNGGQFIFTVDAEPFRYETELTSITIAESGTITNTRMPVCPQITASAACNLIVGTVTYALISGSQMIPSFIFPEGSTTLTVSGSAEVTFSFRKGVL